MSAWRRLWFLLHRRRLERELRQEMEWHLEQRTRELIEEGLDPVRARDSALRAFGNPLHQREESRDWWGFVWLEQLAQDVRHAGRALRRQPLLSAIAVVSLGASMAAACAVFGLANTTLFASLPVPHPSELVVLRWQSGPTMPCDSLDGWSGGTDNENWSTSFSYDAFNAARAAAAGRADVFAFADLYQLNVTSDGTSEVATGQLVSGNYYAALGVRAAAGRLLTPDDDRVDAPETAAVISHAFWRRRFGARRDVVGAKILVNGTPTIIVGVAAQGFEGTRQVGETSDVNVPLMLRDRFVRRSTPAPGQTGEEALGTFDPRYWWVIVMARLRDAADTGGLRSDIDKAVGASVNASRKHAREPFRVFLDPAAAGMREQRAELVQPLTIMALIVAVVVVVACANLATLLLARGAARDHEVAVRHALGASRGRLVRASMLESLMIGAAGGLAGLAATPWLERSLVPALRLGAESRIETLVTGPVLAFACLAVLATSLLFGLLPAWRETRIGSAGGLKAGVSRVTANVPKLRTARAVLIFQVALSLVVVLAAGLMVTTLRNLEAVAPGFDARGVLLFRVDPSLRGYSDDQRRQLLAVLLERIRALPGVESASFSHHALLSGSAWMSLVKVVDGGPAPKSLIVHRLMIEEGFLTTMRIPLLAGATAFSGNETDLVRPVVVNRAFAEKGFGGVASALGHRFRFNDRPAEPSYQVVGVVENARVARLREDPPPTAYFSWRQEPLELANFAVRVQGRPAALIPSVRRTVAAVAPELAIDRVGTQAERINAGIDRERLFAGLASALGGLTLFLACIGIYGLMAYAVSRRTAEIGVRLALGARPREILLMVAREAGRIVGLGAVLGLAAGFAAARSLESLLFGLKPTDLLVQATGVALIAAVAAAAAFGPARRAARTDPLTALRHE